MFTDNYGYLIIHEDSRQTILVDPGDPKPVDHYIRQESLHPIAVLNTHHHPDHVGGNLYFQKLYKTPIFAFSGDAHRIPGFTQGLNEGMYLEFELEGKVNITTDPSEADKLFLFSVYFLPGHTLGHIGFWSSAMSALFCGDVLFSLGSGKLFEGTAEQMWQSLEKLRKLPKKTKIYCAHEYTLENAAFATYFDPLNTTLQEFIGRAQVLRREGLATVPSLLQDELHCNPFLRADSPEFAKKLKLEGKPHHEILGAIRQLKDRFDAGEIR